MFPRWRHSSSTAMTARTPGFAGWGASHSAAIGAPIAHVIDAREEYRVAAATASQIAHITAATGQANAAMAPSAVAIPFPPWKRKYSG